MDNNKTNETQPWDTLRLLVLYRLLLAILFASLNSFNIKPTFVDTSYTTLFTVIALIYTIFAIVFFIAWLFRYPKFFSQTFWQLVLDVIFINLIIFSTGKNGIGLTALLIIPVSMSAYLLSQNYALFIAAIASATLTSFTYSYYGETHTANDITTQHNIIIALLFALALIFSRLAQKSRKDQTKLAQQAEELLNLEMINQQVMDTLTSGVLIVDNAFQIKNANQSAIKYLNLSKYTSQQQLGSNLKKEFKNWLKDPFNNSIVFQETPNTPKLRAKFEPFKNNWSMIVLDKISAINDELQQLKLSSLGRLTASIAHEIRNPLSAINQATQLIEELNKTDDSEKKLTNIILNNTHRMNSMVEKITQLSKKQTFRQETINLKEFLILFRYEFSVVEEFSENQIQINISDEKTQIKFDATHLNQILWNLCSNSIKHGQIKVEQLKIELSTRYHHNLLEIVYRDNGKGIKEEMAESIFEPFYTNSSTGTGLGLYICKELCHLNQADLVFIKTKTGCKFKIVTNIKEQ